MVYSTVVIGGKIGTSGTGGSIVSGTISTALLSRTGTVVVGGVYGSISILWMIWYISK